MRNPIGPNSRYSEHKPSIQQAPASYNEPKKKLSHSTKYKRSRTSGVVRGVVQPIKARAGVFFGIGFRK